MGDNISVHIENSFILSSGISSWKNPIVFRNCNFFGERDITAASQHRSNIQMYFWLENTIVEFHNCNFIGIMAPRWRDRIVNCGSSSITMMNVIVKDNDGQFLNTEGCNITMKDTIVTDNKGHFIKAEESNVEITHSDFRNNKGFFMETQGCNVQITHSVFGDNKGLQLFSVSSDITMMNITVRDNEGCFMKTSGCKVKITDSCFRNNNGYGLLKIYESSMAYLIDSTFTRNQGLNHGTLTIKSSNLTTERCQFLENSAKGKGAAISISRSEYNDHGSLFATNIAGNGGKILSQWYLFFNGVLFVFISFQLLSKSNLIVLHYILPCVLIFLFFSNMMLKC